MLSCPRQTGFLWSVVCTNYFGNDSDKARVRDQLAAATAPEATRPLLLYPEVASDDASREECLPSQRESEFTAVHTATSPTHAERARHERGRQRRRRRRRARLPRSASRPPRRSVSHRRPIMPLARRRVSARARSTPSVPPMPSRRRRALSSRRRARARSLAPSSDVVFGEGTVTGQPAALMRFEKYGDRLVLFLRPAQCKHCATQGGSRCKHVWLPGTRSRSACPSCPSRSTATTRGPSSTTRRPRPPCSTSGKRARERERGATVARGARARSAPREGGSLVCIRGERETRNEYESRRNGRRLQLTRRARLTAPARIARDDALTPPSSRRIDWIAAATTDRRTTAAAASLSHTHTLSLSHTHTHTRTLFLF